MKRVAALVLVLLAVSLSVAALPAAAQTNGTDTNSEYTIDELRQDGKHYSVDGARIVPEEQRIYWLEYTPANQPWREVTKEDNGPKFGSGQTLKTNTLYLRTIRAQEDSESVTVTIVSWDRGTRTVREGNVSREVTVATNVSTIEQQVSLKPGWAMGELNLPRHNEERQVTMWISGHGETARWRFSHESVATTQSIDADTWSEFIMLAGGFIILPALGFGAYGGRKVRSWIEKVGEPPGHGFGYYLLMTTIATALLVYSAYYYAAELIVTVPVLLGIYVGVVYMGYMLATHEGRSEKKLFWQPHIETVESFTSTKIPSIGADDEKEFSFSEDMPFGTMRTYKVLDEGQEGMSIVRSGWLPFLARLKGGRARIENADELKTRFSLWDSAWTECFIIDPDAEHLVEYTPPGLALKTPEIEERSDLIWPGVLLIVGSAIVWQLASIYGVTAWALLLFAIPLLIWKFAVIGTDSHVRIEPAPAAMRPVLASMLAMHVGYDDASTLEEAEEFAWRALAGREQEELSWERDRDHTYVRQSYSHDHTTDESDTDPDIEPAEVEKDD
jgi:hypothetical protein